MVISGDLREQSVYLLAVLAGLALARWVDGCRPVLHARSWVTRHLVRVRSCAGFARPMLPGCLVAGLAGLLGRAVTATRHLVPSVHKGIACWVAELHGYDNRNGYIHVLDLLGDVSLLACLPACLLACLFACLTVCLPTCRLTGWMVVATRVGKRHESKKGGGRGAISWHPLWHRI